VKLTTPGDDPSWVEVTIPGSDRPVGLRRLHVDPATNAGLSLVRFPPGWRRPAAGHYDCAEEFTVLDGRLTVSGVTHGVGDHVYLPPRQVRAASGTETGCLALAFFSARPGWTDGEPSTPPDHPARHGRPVGVLRIPRPGVQGGCRVLDDTPHGAAPVDCDVLSLATADWAWVAEGEPFPQFEPPVMVRAWTGEWR
jgi:hypothetical protein